MCRKSNLNRYTVFFLYQIMILNVFVSYGQHNPTVYMYVHVQWVYIHKNKNNEIISVRLQVKN